MKAGSSSKGIRSPSPIRKGIRSPSPDGPDRPPVVPSRLRKPQISPTATPTNSLPGTHRPQAMKNSSQSPNGTLKSNTQNSTRKAPRSPSRSPKPLRKSSISEEIKPKLPSKTSQSQVKKLSSPTKPSSSVNNSPVKSNSSPNSRLPRPDNNEVARKNSINQDVAPLQTSSPKLSPKSKLVNGKTNAANGDLDDSLDSGSFDQDSLEESEEIESMPPASREAFRHAALVVSSSLKQLSEMAATCTEAQQSGNTKSKDEEKFQKAKDDLTSESRQFVTASKLFVKSATESEETLLQCLSSCVELLQKMVNVTKEVVDNTGTPLQTQNVVLKVRDVASTYQLTVKAALVAAGRGMDHPSMNTLMTQATNLAGVLTSLMRTLRVFSP